jgi:hypothetical protein
MTRLRFLAGRLPAALRRRGGFFGCEATIRKPSKGFRPRWQIRLSPAPCIEPFDKFLIDPDADLRIPCHANLLPI